jgi:2-dehydro-3-deoxygalactonokinase
MVTPTREPYLIGIDWGSSSLRAWLIGTDGAVLDEHATGQGASRLASHGEFGAVFDQVAGAWRAAYPALPVVACGMVGSAHGWRDVPYVRCPADAAALAQATLAVPDGPVIVPGLIADADGAPPDLMRGEETQIVGAMTVQPELRDGSCIVLPGTHSKWSRVEDGRVTGFATYMTGELFAVLRQHSVLGRLMPADADANRDAFLQGVDAVRDHGDLGLSHQLFAARTLGVTQRLAPDALAEYLSGLLIGHELHAGLAWRERAGLAGRPLVLVGESRLCMRYEDALRRFGNPADLVLDNVAPAGLLAIARAAGLLTHAPTAPASGA